MDGYASNAWTEIIGKAAVSPLGIIALIILVAGFVVITLFGPKDRAEIRLLAVFILLLFSSGLAFAAIYNVQPTALPPAEIKGAEIEKPSQQPPQPSEPPPQAKTAPPAPAVAKASTRKDCGTAWTGWVDVGGSVGNPCPSACTRGAELGQSLRAVGFPPRPQVKHKFQCWLE
jgi:hypothetical protein